MAFRTKNRKAERGEVELLRGLVKLANQLQSSLELDAIVSVIATALERDLRLPRGERVPARTPTADFGVHATVGEYPEYDRELFERPVPRHVWDAALPGEASDRLVVLRRPPAARVDRGAAPLPARSSTSGRAAQDEWQQDDDLFVPLYDKNRELMGVLDLYDPADRQLPTLELVKSLEVFATHAAVAIENARQYEAAARTPRRSCRRSWRCATRSSSSAARCSRRSSQREVFARIATLLKEIVDYDDLEIRLVDQERQRALQRLRSDDEDAEQMRCWREPRRRRASAAGSCATTRRSWSTTC